VSLFGTVEGDDIPAQPVVFLNLSSGGALIQAPEQPQGTHHYNLRFVVHNQHHNVGIRVVDWTARDEVYAWRCQFTTLEPAEAEALERAVYGALGLSKATHRDWDEIVAEAERDPEAAVVIGRTPAGDDIMVLGRDSLHMGRDGLQLYVRVVSELEGM
jgi:hypothetical protein